MDTRHLPVILAAAAMLALPVTAAAQRMDQWTGTWKLNVEKSRYEAGPKPDLNTVNTTVELAVVDGRLRITSGPANAHWVNDVDFDGKEHVVKGPMDPTTRVYTRIDDRTYEWVQRVDGKVTTTTRLVLAPDGRSHTVTTSGQDRKGQPVNRRTVYEKQP